MFLFRFRTFIAPVVIKIIYYIGVAGILLWGTMFIISGDPLFGMSRLMATSAVVGIDTLAYSPTYNVMAIPAGVVLTLIWLFMWRFMVEAWLVLFEINDRLGKLVDRD